MPYRQYSKNATIVCTTSSLIVGVLLILAGTMKWQTLILEEVLAVTKQWFQILGIFMLISNVVGLISIESKNKGLLWTFLASTLIIAVVLITHSYSDIASHDKVLAKTDKLLRLSYSQYNISIYKTKVDNFQTMRKCCGYSGTTDVHIQESDGLVKSCCHKKVKKCTTERAYKENCASKKNYTFKLTIMCAILGLVAALTNCLILFFIIYGWIKHFMKVAKEQNDLAVQLRTASHTSYSSHRSRNTYDLKPKKYPKGTHTKFESDDK